MNISLKGIGKRYNRDWIFRNLSYELSAGNGYAILGANGSGKSTLLQVIAGSAMASEGNVEYSQEPETIYKHLSIAAPYLELFEEYTLRESIDLQAKFKPYRDQLSTDAIIATLEMENAANKEVKYFSSGMKQRLKLGLAILSDVPLLLLDEPCSNLDHASVQWYQALLQKHSANRLIIVCSNRQKDEYSFCKQELLVENYK